MTYLYTVPELIQRLNDMDFTDLQLDDGQVVCEAAERLKIFYPVHSDPTGKTREPPHCPTCSCGLPTIPQSSADPEAARVLNANLRELTRK